MTTFEVEYNVPITTLSDQISAREIAKERIKKYRQKKIAVEQDAPPVGSIRRVYWAAKLDSKRGLVQRLKSRVRGFIERLVR